MGVRGFSIQCGDADLDGGSMRGDGGEEGETDGGGIDKQATSLGEKQTNRYFIP